MRISIAFEGQLAVSQTTEAVALAEAKGLDGVWSAEHLGLNDAVVPSAIYAANTRNIEIGLVGPSMASRHPGMLAMELATLASYAPGRVRVQLGVGSPTRAAAMGLSPSRKLADVEELVACTRALLAGESYSGSAAPYELANFRIIAPEIAPPLDVMAMRPRMMELATRIGDGLSLSFGASPLYLADAVELAKTNLAAAGRDESKFRVTALTRCFIDSDIEVAHKNAARFLLRLPYYGIQLMARGVSLPTEEQWASAKELSDDAQAVEAIGVETIEALAVVATPSGVTEVLKRFETAGVDELAIVLEDSFDAQTTLIETLSAMRPAAGA